MAEILRYAGIDLRTVGIYLDNAEGIDSAPPIRGGNLLIPYQTGQRWAQKFYDERHIILNGDMASVVSRADLQTKLDALKTLFPIASGEQRLEAQRTDGSFRYIMAEVRNHMGLQRLMFPSRYTPFSIELVASDPFWYSSVLEAATPRTSWVLDSGIVLDDGAHWLDATATAFSQTFYGVANIEATNGGTAPVRKIVFTLIGGMLSPKITNNRNGLSIQVNRNFGATDVLVIDCGAQLITVNGAPYLQSSLVTLGAGQSDWMRLEPGENTLQLDPGPTTAVPVAYQASYSAAYL